MCADMFMATNKFYYVSEGSHENRTSVAQVPLDIYLFVVLLYFAPFCKKSPNYNA